VLHLQVSEHNMLMNCNPQLKHVICVSCCVPLYLLLLLYQLRVSALPQRACACDLQKQQKQRHAWRLLSRPAGGAAASPREHVRAASALLFIPRCVQQQVSHRMRGTADAEKYSNCTTQLPASVADPLQPARTQSRAVTLSNPGGSSLLLCLRPSTLSKSIFQGFCSAMLAAVLLCCCSVG
jgi:hypothetical protein